MQSPRVPIGRGCVLASIATVYTTAKNKPDGCCSLKSEYAKILDKSKKKS